MEKYYIALICLGLCVSNTRGQSCEEDVNACTGQFTYNQQQQAVSGFNLTAICQIVDEFMSCVDTSLAPCDVITKNTLMSAIDQLINIYTSAPYGCELDFDDDFEYGNCSQEVTECAFFKYDAEEARDNSTEACSQFDKFVECMQQNTTNCEGNEQTEITQSIQNTTDIFSRCPYACGQPNLDCTTTSSSTTPLTTTASVSVFPSPSVSVMSVSQIDMTDFYMVSASDDFYNPSVNPSMYSDDVTPALTDDYLATEFPYETASISDISATATDETTTMSTETTTSSFTSPTTSTTTTTTTTSTAKPTEKPTEKPTDKPTTAKIDPTTTPKATTKKPDATPPTESTTGTPTPTTTKPETTTKSDTTSIGTTDFATPNYDSGATITQQSLVFILTSLILAFLA